MNKHNSLKEFIIPLIGLIYICNKLTKITSNHTQILHFCQYQQEYICERKGQQ
jgi:hypothetical protein